MKDSPEDLKIELINLQCNININHKFSETKLQDFYSCLPEETLTVLKCFELRMTAMFSSTFACEQFFPPYEQ
jgi:hypothetical protein